MEDERRIDTEPDDAFEEILGDVDAHPLLKDRASSPGKGTASKEAPSRAAGPKLAPVRSEAAPGVGEAGVRVFEEGGRLVAVPGSAADPEQAQALHQALMSALDRGVLRFRLDLSQAGDLGAQALAVVVGFGRMLAERGGELEITGAADPLALLLAAAPVHGVRLAATRGAE